MAAGWDKGIKVRIKKLILKRPDISADDIIKALSKDGGEAPSKFTVVSVRSEFRHTLRLLKNEGYIDIDLNGSKKK